MVVTKKDLSDRKVAPDPLLKRIGEFIGGITIASILGTGYGLYLGGREFYRGYKLFGKYLSGKINGFEDRFSEEEKKSLKKNHVWPYVANNLSENFSINQIIEFNKEVSSRKFIYKTVSREFVNIDDINEFAGHFSLKETYGHFINQGEPGVLDDPSAVPAGFAKHLKNRFTLEQIDDIYDIVEADLTSKGPYPQYGKMFDTENVLDVYYDYLGEKEEELYDILAKVILSYDEKYSAEDIKGFLHKEIDSKKVAKYPSEYSGLEISLIHDLGIEPTSKLHDDKKDLLKYSVNTLEKKENSHHRKKFIGSGNEGIIILEKSNLLSDNGTAYKIGYDLENEYELLKKLKKEQPNYEHITRLAGPLNSGQFDILPLEYIETTSLYKDGWYPEGVVADICNLLEGIIVLRKSGIYHNDLHDRNVIRKDPVKLIICDLNSSTLTPQNEKALNRNYSNNDLIAIGLLAYKIHMKKNLFNESNNQSNLSLVKNRIRSERIAAYNDRKILEGKFDQIKKEMYGGLAKSIIYLLDRDIHIQPELPEVEKTLRYVEESI